VIDGFALRSIRCHGVPAYKLPIGRRQGAAIDQANRTVWFNSLDCDRFAVREFASVGAHTVRLQLKTIGRRQRERARTTDIYVINVAERHGTIFNPPNPPQHLSAPALAGPEEPVKQYISALFQSPASTRWDVFTFGTDSSLATTPGWDNVTGLGTPNGTPFIQAVVAEAQK
jgi:hypothetical protein